MSDYQETLYRNYAGVRERLCPASPSRGYSPPPVKTRRRPQPWSDPAKRCRPVKGLTCEQIIHVVASNYQSVSALDVLEYDRVGDVPKARVMAMYLARELLVDNSFPELGRQFNRCHTDILASVRRLSSRIDDVVALYDKHAAIKAQLMAVAE